MIHKLSVSHDSVSAVSSGSVSGKNRRYEWGVFVHVPYRTACSKVEYVQDYVSIKTPKKFGI